MRADDLSKPFAGIRTPLHETATPDALVTAYGERMSGRDFFSHTSAARVPIRKVDTAISSRGWHP